MSPANAVGVKHFRICIAFFLGTLVGRRFGIGTSSSYIYAEEPEPPVPSVAVGNAKSPQSQSSLGNITNNFDHAATRHPQIDDEVHMLYGLSGGEPNFLKEFYVSLKSVLLHAPVDMPMSVHILGDERVLEHLERNLAKSIKVENLVARQPISIIVYNIESKGLGWKKNIEYCTGHKTSKRHTMGTFFRLYAYDVLPPSVQHAVYLDTDVAVLSNLQELWKYRDASSMFQFGLQTRCAGFMILNVRRMGINFWKLVNTTYPKNVHIPVLHKINDQQIFRNFLAHYPELVSAIPPAWDNHRADNFKMFGGNQLLLRRPKMGMLHFNGNGKGAKYNVFEEPKRLEFTAVNYLARHPWEWVGHMMQSQIPPNTTGHPVSVTFKVM